MSYVWMALVGFVVGLVARAVMPGNQKMGMILTALLVTGLVYTSMYFGARFGSSGERPD